jgi:hypothetical protein
MVFGRKQALNILVCLLSAAMVLWFLPTCFAISKVDASTAISQAEQDLGSAYTSVFEADAAGASVSALMDKLDVAGEFVSEAHSLFNLGDYDNAFTSAQACSSAVEGVVGEAARLKVDAEITHNAGLFLSAVVSGVGVGLFLLFAFFGWRILKRWYFRRLLDMKPEAEVAK